MSSILQHNEFMNIRSKPTFVPHGHHHLFAFLLVCLFSHMLACILVSLLAMPIMLIRFMPFHMLFASFPSIACLLVSCLCLCMYTHEARMCGARAQFPRRKQRGRGYKHVDIIRAAVVSRFRSLAFSSLVMYSFKNPFLPLPFLP